MCLPWLVLIQVQEALPCCAGFSFTKGASLGLSLATQHSWDADGDMPQDHYHQCQCSLLSQYTLVCLLSKITGRRAERSCTLHSALKSMLLQPPRSVLLARWCLQAGSPHSPIASASRGCLGQGQLAAVWSHSVSDAEVRELREAGFAMLMIHGRHDILAAPVFGERLAHRCTCFQCVMLCPPK